MKSCNKLAIIFFLLSLSFLISFGRCNRYIEIRTKSIFADRDTYIDSNSTDSNYGGKDWISIGELIIGYDHAFLHFDLRGAPEEFNMVYITLYFFYISETIDISFYTTANNWSELSLTWNNAPSEDLLIRHFLNIAEEGRINFNIWSFMHSWNDDEISIIIEEYDDSETGYIQASSKEGANSESYKPCINYEYEVGIDLTIIPFVIIGVVAITITIVIRYKRKKRKIREEILPAKLFDSPYTISTSKFCSNCGAKVNSQFCTNCGKEQI